MISLEFHEVSNIFPLLEGPAFDDLREDIAAHGVLEPITLHEGKIVDGRNRYRACRQLGIVSPTREWLGQGNLLEYVVSLNLHRRHLNESQRSMVAAKIKPRFEVEARERQAHGTTAPGKPHKESDPPTKPFWGDEDQDEVEAEPPSGINGTLPANLREASPGESSEKAAALLNVSARSVDAASRVLNKGTPELIKAVEAGKVKVSAAAQVAKLPKEQQQHVVSQGPKAVKQAAKDIKKGRTAPDPKADQIERHREHFLRCVSDIDDLTRAVSARVKDGGFGGLPVILEKLGRHESLVLAGKLETLIERLRRWTSQIKDHFHE